MDIHQAIAGRRSVRDYAAETLDERTIGRLIDAAVLAPSAMNQQPWTFTVVRDPALLDRLSHAAKAHMLATLPADPASGQFRSLLSSPDFEIFYHAPALILISAAAEGPMIVEDCALAAQNLMLAAYAEGLGSCWIGFAQAYLGTAEGKALLGLPATSIPVAPIIVGRPKSVAAPVPRNPPQVRWIG
jgi:nitroreductase